MFRAEFIPEIPIQETFEKESTEYKLSLHLNPIRSFRNHSKIYQIKNLNHHFEEINLSSFRPSFKIKHN